MSVSEEAISGNDEIAAHLSGARNDQGGIGGSLRGIKKCLARAKKRNPESQAPNSKQFQSINDQNSLEI